MADPHSQRNVALPGGERQLVPGSQVLGPVDLLDVLDVTTRLRSRASDADLAAQVDALGTTPPAERTYLTHEQFAEQYGADPAAMQRVGQFARDHQLTVVESDFARRTITLSGNAQVVSAAFQVELVRYSSPRDPIGAAPGRCMFLRI